MTRKKYMVGNWKMNQILSDIDSFFSTFNKAPQDFACVTWIAPQFPHLSAVIEKGNTGTIKAGAQNCSHQESGALTGDVSPVALKDLGCVFTLIGHSERRSIFNESDELLKSKTKLALETGLEVIFCVGESLEEREAGKTTDVVLSQLTNGLKGIDAELLKKVIIAYEPVWAIGTGKTATPEQAEEVHLAIRNHLSSIGLDSDSTSILYGGSVKPDNVEGLMAQPNIDGGLVGGASLKADSFLKLCQAAK